MGERGLGAVLGEDRHPAVAAQLAPVRQRPQGVGRAVQRLVHLGPGQRGAIVDERDPTRPWLGLAAPGGTGIGWVHWASATY